MREELGGRIRRAREAAGLTQNELAQRINARESQVSLWESGKNEPRVSTLRQIAEALGVRLAALLSDDDEPSASPRAAVGA